MITKFPTAQKVMPKDLFLKRIFFAAVVVFLIFPYASFAAKIFITPDRLVVLAEGGVPLAILLNTEGEEVSAFEGNLLFPADSITPIRVKTGDFTGLWVEKPRASSSGKIYFSGIFPGGLVGNSIGLFSVDFSAARNATGTVRVEDAKVFKNDGGAAAIPIAPQEKNFQSLFSSSSYVLSDTVSPEPFTPQILRNDDIENGKYFLVFTTADKGVGVDHYEVLELRTGEGEIHPWKTASSPYILEDQSLASDVYVRAVDGAGNFIVAKIPAMRQAPFGGSRQGAFFLGAGIATMLLLWLWVRKSGARNAP